MRPLIVAPTLLESPHQDVSNGTRHMQIGAELHFDFGDDICLKTQKIADISSRSGPLDMRHTPLESAQQDLSSDIWYLKGFPEGPVVRANAIGSTRFAHLSMCKCINIMVPVILVALPDGSPGQPFRYHISLERSCRADSNGVCCMPRGPLLEE